MANVKRCDICGGIFEAFGEAPANYGIFAKYIEHFDRGEQIDCCPACTTKIVDFIDILKTGEPYKLWIDPPEGVDATCQE